MNFLVYEDVSVKIFFDAIFQLRTILGLIHAYFSLSLKINAP